MAELPERLREAADAHRPDRERLLARVERARAAPDGRAARPRGGERAAGPWMRVVAVAAAVAGAVGLGGLAVGAVTQDGEPARSGVTSAAPTLSPHPQAGSAAPGAAAANTRAHSRHRTTAPEHHSGSPHPPGHVTGAPPGTSRLTAGSTPVPATPAPRTAASGPAAGDVTCAGTLDSTSTPSWTQSEVTLTTGRPLTSLSVELRVARTSGVAGSGSFSTAPGQTLGSVSVEGDQLVYRWLLAPDATLGPGSYTFAGQFDHDPGDRDTSGDRYAVAADGPGGPATFQGGF